MTSGQKTAVSLLVSVLLFGAFVAIAFLGVFNVIDTRFYEPAKISEIQKKLDLVSENYNEYIEGLESRFGKSDLSFLNQKSVATYIDSNPSDQAVRQRSKLSGDLFSQTPGLLGMRLIDKNSKSIHFSTFSNDVLNRTDETVSYKNYDEAVTLSGDKEIPFEKINSPDDNSSGGIKARTFFDGKNNRIIISFPFYDSYSAYRGSFVFYVNANDFNRVLLSKKLISFGDTGVLVSDAENREDSNYKSGFVFGMPIVGREVFAKEILNRWERGIVTPEKIVYSEIANSFDSTEYIPSENKQTGKEKYWVLVSSVKTPVGYVGGIYPDDLLLMSDSVKILMLVCLFITVFLVVFLIANVKQDDMVVIRERIRRLQLGLVNEYLKKKENVDWKAVSEKIAGRRSDVTKEILKGLGRKGKKHSDKVTELINKSWDELLAAMNVQVEQNPARGGADYDELKKMLEQILSSGTINVRAVQSDSGTAPVQPVNKAKPVVASPEPVEELEDAEPVEEAETLEEVEDAESVEELEDAEPVEEAEALEEVEDAESVEELEDAEPVEEAEALEEVEDAESVEELEDAEPVEEAESVEEVSPDMFDESSEKRENHNPDQEIESFEDVERINRDVFAVSKDSNVDDEDNEMVENFSVENPDFSSLDDVSYEGENKDGPAIQNNEAEKEKTETVDTEEVSIDNFDVKFSEQEIQLEEELKFGSVMPERKESTEAVSFDVEPSKPDFKILDDDSHITFGSKRKRGEKDLIGESNFSIKNIQEEVQASSVGPEEDIAELAPVDINVPFSFTGFGKVQQESVVLEPYVDVIKEDDSGIFYIQTDGQEEFEKSKNLDFQALVNSVLKK